MCFIRFQFSCSQSTRIMDKNPEISFQRLRPTCAKLSKQPTRQGIEELRDLLGEIETCDLVKLTEYVLFPLQLTLQRVGLSNELKEDAVKCIEAVILKAKVHKLNVFSDLFNALTVLLSDKEPGKVAKVSEELKLASLNCLDCLLDNCGLVIRSVLYRPKFLPSLGHAISLFLDVIQHEKARELKIAGLKCLKIISFCDSYNARESLSATRETANQCNGLEEREKHDLYLNIRDSASAAMSSFLPGISLGLVKAINSDPTLGHVIITLVVDIWGTVISMVMSGSCVQNCNSISVDDDDTTTTISLMAKLQTNETRLIKDKLDNHHIKTDETPNSKDLRVNKTVDWLKSTASKLKMLIEKLLSTVSCHSNWKVRLSLVNFCESVLLNCSETMPCCIPLLVDALVGCLEDEYNDVSLRSKDVLDLLAQSKDKRDRNSFCTILEENLHTQLTALPRLMRTADDVNKVRALNLLNGYISLLNDRISNVLSSMAHLKRLSLALIQILELDVTDVGIVEERTPERHESAVIPSDTQGGDPLSVNTTTVNVTQYPKYRFKHFTGDKIQAAVNHTCQSLGFFGDLSLLVDHFLDLFHDSEVHQKQAVYILNEIIVGFCRKLRNGRGNSDSVADDIQGESTELMPAVKLILSTFTSPKYWNLPTSHDSFLPNKTKADPRPSISYQKLNSNIQLTCLLLEGIGIFADSLQHNFSLLLIDMLYLVLAKLGDSNAAISRAAYGTLVMISKSCGCSSVEDLITSNADYLVNSIALDLKYVFVNEQAPRVLRVMIEYSNEGVLDILEDTISDVFCVIDLYPDQLLHAVIKVLHALVCSIYHWFIVKQTSNQVLQTEQEFKGMDKFSCKVTTFILNYIRSKRIALGEVESDDLPDNDENNMVDDDDDEDFFKPDEKPQVPLHIKFSTEVLEKCIHFLSSVSSVVRILVLDTVRYGVLALQKQENDLLPMIHRLWPPIVNRLTDKDQAVTIKAIYVIAAMAECSGDFMKRRVTKDVLPKLVNLLEKQAEVSLKAGPIYSQSQTFKLQVAALQGLGRLCKQLMVREEHLYNVACVCRLYLSSQQPIGLQKDAVATFENFITVDPDIVWLVLNNLYCPAVPKPPHDMFMEVMLQGDGPDSKEYSSNVSLLLGKINANLCRSV